MRRCSVSILHRLKQFMWCDSDSTCGGHVGTAKALFSVCSHHFTAIGAAEWHQTSCAITTPRHHFCVAKVARV